MDVRLSPEQVAARLGRPGRRPARAARGRGAGRPRAGRQARRRRRRLGLAQAAHRHRRRAPWASGVEVALVAEELGRGLADAPFLGPTLAAELRRLAGAPPAAPPETVALAPDLTAVGCSPEGPPGRGLRGRRCAGRGRRP